MSVFKKNVIEKYKDNYKNQITKKAGARLEWGAEFIINKSGEKSFSLLSYGNVKKVSPRYVCCNSIDIYDTGKARGSVYYPDFGVCKYIYYMPSGGNWSGDFTGKYED